LELDLVAQRDPVGAHRGDLGLEAGPAAINGTAMHPHQAEAAALVPPWHVGKHAQQLPVGGLRDKRRMVQGMDQFPQPGRPETVVPVQERLGRSLVGGLRGRTFTASPLRAMTKWPVRRLRPRA
jgi:hypothetical protein